MFMVSVVVVSEPRLPLSLYAQCQPRFSWSFRKRTGIPFLQLRLFDPRVSCHPLGRRIPPDFQDLSFSPSVFLLVSEGFGR